MFDRHFGFENVGGGWSERVLPDLHVTAVKCPKRFSFYLVGFYLMLSGNMGKNV